MDMKLFNLFKSKENYTYFKRQVNFYYGLCGCKREFKKVKDSKGSFSIMNDYIRDIHIKKDGWVYCTELEYKNQ